MFTFRSSGGAPDPIEMQDDGSGRALWETGNGGEVADQVRIQCGGEGACGGDAPWLWRFGLPGRRDEGEREDEMERRQGRVGTARLPAAGPVAAPVGSSRFDFWIPLLPAAR